MGSVSTRMRLIRRGDSGPGALEVRQTLVTLGLLASGSPGSSADPEDSLFDAACELALREFQQARGLSVDGLVGPETWRALVAARWRLGDRVLTRSFGEPTVGDDVRVLQERLLEMGYDAGRADGVFGARAEQALRSFQRECGLIPDGTFGPHTMRALRRLGRKVVGGRPHMLRENEALHSAGPALVGKRIVVDPGHGGNDPGMVVPDGRLTWSEAEIAYDLAARLEGRFVAAGIRVDLTRGRDTGYSDGDRAAFANASGADLLISLHLDGQRNPAAHGVATYHFGTGSGATSTVGERLAGLVQREIVARTGMRDCRTHAKTWELLRLTRMPAVRVEAGYLSSPEDRAKLIDPMVRDTIADSILAAVQRVFFATDAEVATGTLDVRSLRAAVAAPS